MKIRLRSLRQLADISVTVDGNVYHYSVPVNFFEHIAKCTDWRKIIEMYNNSDNLLRYGTHGLYPERYIAISLFDHYILARRIMIESLDPEFYIPHKRWSRPIWINASGSRNISLRLRSSCEIHLQIYNENSPVSTLKTTMKRILTGEDVIETGKTFLIVGNMIVRQDIDNCDTWQDVFVNRNSEMGREMENEYRREEKRR